MKKFWSVILTAIMAATMIGSATVTAQAEAKATCVADVVAFMKECQPDETLTFRPVDGCIVEYRWVYTDPSEVDVWMQTLTSDQKAELFDVLSEIGATLDDLSGWTVECQEIHWHFEALN